MPGEIVSSAKSILNYVEELRGVSRKLNSLKRISKPSEEQKKQIDDLTSKEKELYGKIGEANSNIYNIINPKIEIPKPHYDKEEVPKQKKEEIKPVVEGKKVLQKPKVPVKEKEIPVIHDYPKKVPSFSSKKFRNLTQEEKKRYIKELSIKPEELEKFIKLQKERKRSKISLKKENYSIYHPSDVGKVANRFMKKYADSLVEKYPKFFEPMFGHFKMVEMELLSRTYVSMMLFFTILALPGLFLFLLALNFAFNLNILTILIISIIGTIATFAIFYMYPASLIGGKNSKIKLELPFALVHMSAVAGSGAQPVSIFQLIADSKEYPELRKEIKKILNYVNLFGYNLTNALRNVAKVTPNPELKELLNGMVSTIETGGDLRSYLKEKSDEALNTYKLDRKKQVQALSTFSEIYTAILIASPLLLLVTLAIINSIGGNIGGMGVGTIAWIGILGVLPLLNIGFMVFLTISQKGL